MSCTIFAHNSDQWQVFANSVTNICGSIGRWKVLIHCNEFIFS